MRLILCCLMMLLGPGAASADPGQVSCRILAVVGGNQSNEVSGLVDDIAQRWTPKNRDAAKASLTQLVGTLEFVGGAVFRVSQFGEEAEEHLVFLRLAAGEVAGFRVLYQWTPEGMALVTLNFQRTVADLLAQPIAQRPEPLACS